MVPKSYGDEELNYNIKAKDITPKEAKEYVKSMVNDGTSETAHERYNAVKKRSEDTNVSKYVRKTNCGDLKIKIDTTDSKCSVEIGMNGWEGCATQELLGNAISEKITTALKSIHQDPLKIIEYYNTVVCGRGNGSGCPEVISDCLEAHFEKYHTSK